MSDNYVSISKFIEKVYEVEHVLVGINAPSPVFLIKQYEFTEPAPENMTVSEFRKKRIDPYLKTIKEPTAVYLYKE